MSELYDRYSGLVYSQAHCILRDAGAPEEILQDLFYQVWRTTERFDPSRGSLAGWLLVAARNRAISRLRRKTWKTEEPEENDFLERLIIVRSGKTRDSNREIPPTDDAFNAILRLREQAKVLFGESLPADG